MQQGSSFLVKGVPLLCLLLRKLGKVYRLNSQLNRLVHLDRDVFFNVVFYQGIVVLMVFSLSP